MVCPGSPSQRCLKAYPADPLPPAVRTDKQPIITGSCQVFTSNALVSPPLYDHHHNACLQGQWGSVLLRRLCPLVCRPYLLLLAVKCPPTGLALLQGWIPNLERKLEVAAETAHADFRCFFSAEPINGAPQVRSDTPLVRRTCALLLP